MTDNLINSPIVNEIITMVEKIGPITLDALRVIFPCRDLERRVRSAWGYLDRIMLDGERAVAPAQGTQGFADEKRQKAYAWLVARCVEAGLELQDGKVIFPKGVLGIKVAPDKPAGQTLLVVPEGFAVPPKAKQKNVYIVREEDLKRQDLRTAMKLGSAKLKSVS